MSGVVTLLESQSPTLDDVLAEWADRVAPRLSSEAS
jgi:hypothetical protein